MTIGKTCINDVKTIGENYTLEQAAQLMLQNNIGFLVVVGDDNESPVGTLTDRDIVIRAIAKGKSCSNAQVKEIMSTDLLNLEEDLSIKEAIEQIGYKGVRRAPVVKNKKLVGATSLDNLIIMISDELSYLADTIKKQIS